MYIYSQEKFPILENILENKLGQYFVVFAAMSYFSSPGRLTTAMRYTSTSTFTLGNSDHNLLIHLLDILHSYSLQQITYFLYARGHILFCCKLTHLVISRCGEKWGREEGGQEERTGIDAAQKYMFTFFLEVQIFIFLHFSKSLFLHRIFIILLEFYQHCVVTKRKSAIPRAEKFGRRQTVAAVAEAVVSREPSCRVMLIEGLTRVLQF